MNTTKFLVGGIVGGVVFFLLGWLVYGILMKDFMEKNMGTATGVSRAEDQMVFWALILGNLFMGFLLSYVFARSGTYSLKGGFITGFIVGLLLCAGMDFIMHGVTNLMTTTGVMADIAVSAVMWGVTGAIVGLVMGKVGNSTNTAA